MELKDLNLKCLMFQGSIDTHENSAYGDIRLGGVYIIRNVIESAGIESHVIDFLHKFSHKDILRLQKIIEKFNPDFITISDTFLDQQILKQRLYDIKKLFPSLVVIAGSSNPQPEPNRLIDYRIYSYGENAIIKVLEHHFLARDLKFTKKGNTKWVNALRDYPAWPKDDYALRYKPDDFMTNLEPGCLELSRGCRFKCKFCNWPILGIKQDTSQKEIQSIVEALNHNYHTSGVYSYHLADDTFNDRDSKIERLANVVKRLPFEPNFTAFIRLDLVISRPQQLDLLINARVWGHFYGIETLHPDAAKAIGKGMHPDRIKKGLLETKAAFMDKLGLYRGTCGMIAGLPFEPVDSWHKSLEWMNENWDCYLFWGLHISTDPNMNTHSDFSIDAARYGYVPTKNKEVIKWAEDKGLLDIKSTVTHKLDKHIMIWEAEWANFKQATEFSDYYNSNYFSKIKVPNFELLNYCSKDNILDITAQDAYIDKIYKAEELDMISNYIEKKINSV